MEGTDELARTQAQVRAAQGGDTAALDQLVSRYLPRIRGIVAARMGRRLQALVDVDDMVQETLRLAIVGLARFEYRSEGSFQHWLAQCVENAIRNEHRRRSALKRDATREAHVCDLGETRLAETVFPDESPNASHVARRRENLDRLEDAMLELAPRYREVIVLRAFGEMPYKQIAEVMELPSENTANALFVRARRKLMDTLGSIGE